MTGGLGEAWVKSPSLCAYRVLLQRCKTLLQGYWALLQRDRANVYINIPFLQRPERREWNRSCSSRQMANVKMAEMGPIYDTRRPWDAQRLTHSLQQSESHRYTLQDTAIYCNTLPYKTLQYIAIHYNTLQHTATHCNTRQHTATHCNTLQHNATQCNKLQQDDLPVLQNSNAHRIYDSRTLVAASRAD